MPERRVFGRVEFDHEDKKYMVELTKQGLVVWEKRHLTKARVGIRHIVKLLDKQPEFFMINQPKPPTTAGERAIEELRQVHVLLALATGCHSDGVNWRYMLQVLTTNQKEKNETEIRTNESIPHTGEGDGRDTGQGLPLPTDERG